MGRFSAGQVVFLPFPFSDLSRSKQRPALLLAESGGGDWVICQITSNPYSGPLVVGIGKEDFAQGALPRSSFVRPNKLFTADESLFSQCVASLNSRSFALIRDAVITVIRSN